MNVVAINDARPDARARIARLRASRLWRRTRFVVEGIGWIVVLGLLVPLLP